MRYKLLLILTLTYCCVNTSCSNKSKKTLTDSDHQEEYLDSTLFNSQIDGKNVKLYTLKNKSGFTVYLTNFGARIVGILTPDKNGNLTDVVLGFNSANAYYNEEEPYFGPIVGPVANRVAKGKFAVNDKSYDLTINNGPNTLHGGKKGLHFVVWNTEVFKDSIRFQYTHENLQDGFPGNKNISVTYSINDNNELTINYRATSDQDTYINLSNHAYFNLNGEGSGTILDHQLEIDANDITPVDETLIPTGELTAVSNTPFDFNSSKTIGKDINQKNNQLTFGKGYDHNFVLNSKEALKHASTLVGDKTGIVMDIYTTEPGLQFYSGNFMSDKVTLKSGAKDSFRTGLCLEPQNFPDAPNQPNFPNSLLKKGQTYNSKSIYKFSIK